MTKFLTYFSLATGLISSVSAIQAVFAGPVTGEKLEAAVAPLIQEVAFILPHVKIPPDLITKCCSTVAEVINDYFKKK